MNVDQLRISLPTIYNMTIFRKLQNLVYWGSWQKWVSAWNLPQDPFLAKKCASGQKMNINSLKCNISVFQPIKNICRFQFLIWPTIGFLRIFCMGRTSWFMSVIFLDLFVRGWFYFTYCSVKYPLFDVLIWILKDWPLMIILYSRKGILTCYITR